MNKLEEEIIMDVFNQGLLEHIKQEKLTGMYKVRGYGKKS